MTTRSQQMIDAANDAQERFCQNELKKQTGKDYSGWSMFEIITEMKRLADEIRSAK